ncbi:MAG: efflux RND transporter periplasmic adaptor subunit [Candidatus Aminicenantes bacterium]|jgi:cobalt-zinc-cadmium efflux system membrane fusion protein
MKKEHISLLVLFALVGWGMACAKKTNESSVADEGTSQKESVRTADTRLQGKRRGRNLGTQAVGRGFQKRGFGRQNLAWSPGDVIELSPEEREAIEIATVTAAYRTLRTQLQAVGKVYAHPKRKAIVSYAFPARISNIHIQIGDWVKAGQELVTLQSEEVGSAKSEFYKAKADYELAKVNCERAKRLYDRGVGAEKDYLACEAEFKVAEANLNAAEKKLHVLGFSEAQVKTISETHQINPVITLFAPLSGKIIEYNAVLGAMVDLATEILTILDPQVLVVDAEIYEKDIAKIRIGQQVEVTVPAYPGENFEGKVIYISDILHEETRTIKVRAEVENREYKLKPGMFADVIIYLNHQVQALVLPKEAILDEKDEYIIFLQRDGKYLPTVVELGAREGGFIEVIRGIQEGDRIVTTGNFQLKSKLYDEILKKGHVH